jgi:hypothetical protein
MSIRQQARTAAVSAAHPRWPREAPAVLFFGLAIVPLVFPFLVRTPLVLPTLSLMSLASAGLLALAAWWMSSDRNCPHINLWDLSGACAFIGFAAGMLSEPEHILELWTAPANGHDPAR